MLLCSIACGGLWGHSACLGEESQLLREKPFSASVVRRPSVSG